MHSSFGFASCALCGHRTHACPCANGAVICGGCAFDVLPAALAHRFLSVPCGGSAMARLDYYLTKFKVSFWEAAAEHLDNHGPGQDQPPDGPVGLHDADDEDEEEAEDSEPVVFPTE